MAEKTLQQRKEDAEKIITELQWFLDFWKSKKDEIEKWFNQGQEITDFYDNTFVELKKLLEDEDNWLDATRFKALDLLGRLDEIEKLVEEKKSSAEKNETKINEILEVNKKLKTDLESMLWIATDKTLSNSFDNRYKQLTAEKGFWKWASIIGFVIFTIITVATLFTFQGDLTVFLIEKVGILIPLAIISYLFYYEYKRIDKKAEDYAFKRTIASTLNAYTEILESKIIDDEKNSEFKTKILSFLLSSMENVYKEPANEKTAELEFRTKFMEQEFSLKNTEKDGKQDIIIKPTT